MNEISEEYENNDEVNAALLWDTMKMKIRSSSLHYSKIKKAKMKSQETNLELEIISLHKTLEESNLSEMEKNQSINEIEIRNLQREEISKHKLGEQYYAPSRDGTMKERKTRNIS